MPNQNETLETGAPSLSILQNDSRTRGQSKEQIQESVGVADTLQFAHRMEAEEADTGIEQPSNETFGSVTSFVQRTVDGEKHVLAITLSSNKLKVSGTVPDYCTRQSLEQDINELVRDLGGLEFKSEIRVSGVRR